MQNGVVLVYTTGTRTPIPGCASAQPQRFAFDSTTAAGKSQLSGMLAADASKRPIIIVGSDVCNVYSDSETLSYYYFAD